MASTTSKRAVPRYNTGVRKESPPPPRGLRPTLAEVTREDVVAVVVTMYLMCGLIGVGTLVLAVLLLVRAGRRAR